MTESIADMVKLITWVDSGLAYIEGIYTIIILAGVLIGLIRVAFKMKEDDFEGTSLFVIIVAILLVTIIFCYAYMPLNTMIYYDAYKTFLLNNGWVI